MNIVMITADDLNYGCLGCGGCDYPDVTPNIDNLAQTGFVFERCYSNIALCQQSRSVQMTGLYPHNNGAVGFNAIKSKTLTLVEILKNAGYFTGILGKTFHLLPFERFPWDVVIPKTRKGMREFTQGAYGSGRSPGQYVDFVRNFLKKCGRPYFLLLNSHDPHRPFPESKTKFELKVPPYLPRNNAVIKELNNYYSAVQRLDTMVGMVRELVDDALIIFTSDHGMPFSFAKANCYPMSVHVPLIFNHPSLSGKSSTIFEGVDLLPTVCNLLNISHDPVDGVSLRKCFDGFDYKKSAFVQFFRHLRGPVFSTRSLISDRWCYVRNFWWDKKMKNYSLDCMQSASYHSLSMDRKKFLRLRCKEEFYDLSIDPFVTTNIINNQLIQPHLQDMKKQMLDRMLATKDPDTNIFEYELNESVRTSDCSLPTSIVK